MTTIASAQSDALSSGNAAYAAGNYAEAKDHYSRLVADEKMSASLFYNLGNCFYQLDELGEAIWAYERSLKINPGHENARFNLAFAQKQTYDNLTPESSDVLRWFRGTFFVLGLNFWSWISIISLLVFCILLYFFFTTKNPKIKNYALTFGFVFFGLLNAAGLLAMLHKQYIIERHSAIIIEDSVIIRTSPSDTAKEAFNLHEGTKVDLERSNEDWIEISVNGNTGWVEKEALLEI
jgi:tetratricopeptide (TPR) repeat protein